MSSNAGRCGPLLAAVLALWSAFPTPALAETLSFNPSQLLGVGSGPWAIAVGDFNGDRINDLAVVNYQSDNISVFLGNGDGTFRPPVTYAVGDGPTSIEVGNFNGNANGDGTTDLVVANYLSTTVTVLMSNGDGTFQTARTLVVGVNPTFVAAGDFNADGKLDLVVTPYGCFGYADCPVVSQTVSVLLGNGDGTFQPPAQFPAGSGPNAVAVADLNGDGKLDLAVADYGPSTQRAPTIAVLLGNGDGTVQLTQAFYAYLSPAFVAVGDFTGGGRPGLAGGHHQGGPPAGVLHNTPAPPPEAPPPL